MLDRCQGLTCPDWIIHFDRFINVLFELNDSAFVFIFCFIIYYKGRLWIFHGTAHEFKTMNADDAFAVTTGLYLMKPTVN